MGPRAASGLCVFLALTALKMKRNEIVSYHVMLALLGIGIALGRYSSVFWLLHHYFPFFKFIRYPARFLYLFSFAIACLAGFGLDAVLAKKRA